MGYIMPGGPATELPFTRLRQSRKLDTIQIDTTGRGPEEIVEV